MPNYQISTDLLWLAAAFFRAPVTFPKGDVGGGGRGAAFSVFLPMIVVVGKVESPPDKDQYQGKDAVAGHVKTGKVEKHMI